MLNVNASCMGQLGYLAFCSLQGSTTCTEGVVYNTARVGWQTVHQQSNILFIPQCWHLTMLPVAWTLASQA